MINSNAGKKLNIYLLLELGDNCRIGHQNQKAKNIVNFTTLLKPHNIGTHLKGIDTSFQVVPLFLKSFHFWASYIGWIKKKRVKSSTAISQKLCIIIGRTFSRYYYIMLSSFTVNYTFLALLMFPQHQKQNMKSKTAMLHSRDTMAPGNDTE
jgi:hypothetical protein